MKKRIRHGDPQRRSLLGRGGAAVEGRRPIGAGVLPRRGCAGVGLLFLAAETGTTWPAPASGYSSRPRLEAVTPGDANRRVRPDSGLSPRHGATPSFLPVHVVGPASTCPARLRRPAAWRSSWRKAARCGCGRASTGKRSPTCWPCWRCGRAEPVGVGADLRVLGADRYAKKFRHSGRPGAGLAGIRSACPATCSCSAVAVAIA